MLWLQPFEMEYEMQQEELHGQAHAGRAQLCPTDAKAQLLSY